MANDSLKVGTAGKRSGTAWYYSRGDERVGPITSRELKVLAKNGDITQETLVWRQGLKDWVPARKVKGLFAEETTMALADSDVLAVLSRGEATKQCPFCAETIKPEAMKCRYCGELIPPGNQIVCPSCKQSLAPGTVLCVTCGYDFKTGQRATPMPMASAGQARQISPNISSPPFSAPQHSVTGRTKGVAALLGFFLGGIGIHKFYLGQSVQGVFYLLFCWTLIPGIIGFIEGIIYICQSQESFDRQYNR